MSKIVLIGAGSAVFSRNLIADILSYPALSESEIHLVDTDERRLGIALKMARSINLALGGRARFETAAHYRDSLDGADFVLNMIGVGGAEAVHTDLEVPLAHGLRQTVGDTLGVGGIFRSARSIPVLLEIAREMERRAPRALLLNYTNPMATHVLAVARETSVRVVGLCHGIVHTAQLMRMLVEMVKIPEAEIEAHFRKPWNSPERTREWLHWLALGDDPALSYTCAGINHMAAFLRFESGGVDLYPRLWEAMKIPHLKALDPVRIELAHWLGYFITETSGHCAEYLPYYLKDAEATRRANLRVAGYLESIRDLDQAVTRLEADLQEGQSVISLPYRRSVEYASRVINAITTNTPYVFNGNVHNRGGALISNLPGDCCVEVPCVADAAGVTPTVIGDLPPQIAALNSTNIHVQDLIVRGVVGQKRDYLYQAAMLDPNTSSTLSLPQIKALMDEMFARHTAAGHLPETLRLRGTLRHEVLSEAYRGLGGG